MKQRLIKEYFKEKEKVESKEERKIKGKERKLLSLMSKGLKLALFSGEQAVSIIKESIQTNVYISKYKAYCIVIIT